MAAPRRPEVGSNGPEAASAALAECSSTLSSDASVSAPIAPPSSPAGRSLPFTLSERYLVDRELGRGGMGSVYLAHDTRMKRPVAIKLLTSAAATPGQLSRFEREALLVASLGHPNVLAVHDIGTDVGQPYIVQEFLEGTSLRERLARDPLSIDEALGIATQIARGLGAAHEKGIVHCDLKPENVLVSSDGWVKILDFGVARLVTTARAAEPAGDGAASEGFAGTLRYSSPEQIRGRVLDARSDIFSFGVVLYELLIRRVPFEGRTSTALSWAILNDTPRELPPEVPQGLRSVVKRCLQKDRRNRFQSGKDLAFALEAISAGRQGPWWTRRRVMLAIAGAVPAVTVGVGWAISRRRRVAPRFRQLTFFPGAIWTARFHEDGETVSYTETWDGHLPRVFSTRLRDQGYHRLDLDDAVLLGVSRKDDLAILTHPRFEGFDYVGTAAIVPPSGGAPRDVAADARGADWANDGSLAIVRSSGGRQRLEFPIGHVLHEATGWLDAVRVSPRADFVALVEHPTQATDIGNLVVVSRSGERRVLVAGWGSMHGVAWNAAGNEIWFTGSPPEPTDAPAGIRATTLDGRIRSIADVAGALNLQDTSARGDILLTQPQRYIGIVAHRGASEVDLSMMDQQLLHDLSRDGSIALFTVKDATAPDENGALYIRGTDGSAPMRIAAGYGGALAPDAKSAVVFSIAPFNTASLVPIGPGVARELKAMPFTVTWARFFPDGQRVLFAGETRDQATRLFLVDLRGGDPLAVSPEGVDNRWFAVSPGGGRIAAVLDSTIVLLLPTAGDKPRPVPGTGPGEKPFGWADESTLLVGRELQAPLQIDAVDVRSGTRKAWKVVRPGIPGVQAIRRILFAANGDTFVYEHVSRKTHLYLLDNPDT